MGGAELSVVRKGIRGVLEYCSTVVRKVKKNGQGQSTLPGSDVRGP